MKKRIALKVIFIISIIGILFSGYLSYMEVFAGSCELGECTSIFEVPACVYGFVMYLVIFVISLLGLVDKGGEAAENGLPLSQTPVSKSSPAKSSTASSKLPPATPSTSSSTQTAVSEIPTTTSAV